MQREIVCLSFMGSIALHPLARVPGSGYLFA